VDPIVDAWQTLVRRHASRPLLVTPGGVATIDDVERSSRAALAQVRNARSDGRLAALSGPNGPGLMAAFLALRRADRVVLLVDWRTPPATMRRIAEELGCDLLVKAGGGAHAGFELEALTPLTGASLAADVAVLKLTSGSSGRPRGVAVTSEALIADDRQLVATMGIRADDRLLAAVPLTHSYGFASVLLPAILRGIVVATFEEEPAGGPMAAARALGATVLPTVPAYLSALVRASRPPRAAPSLRLVIAAGAPLEAETATAFRHRYRQPVHVFYGASECGGIAFDREGGAAERGTVGTAVDGVSIDLLEAGTASGGIVAVRSAAVASGYVPDPEPGLGGGAFETADLGRWRGGELVLEGRADDVINVRGRKVRPLEVEAVLRDIPGVAEVAVVGVVVATGGEIVRAAIVAKDPALDEAAIRAFCQRRLAAHQVPRSILLLERLPRTVRGKLDRKALRAADAGAVLLR
jgi:long-chain acyl-CoA synthetase